LLDTWADDGSHYTPEVGVKIALIVLSIALVASIAAGFAGLWPNLRDRSSVNDRRERVRIAEALDRDRISHGYHVSRVKLDYIPGKALVEVTEIGHTDDVGECAVVNENFGDHMDSIDIHKAACDF
jgi:hypothetical protein